MLEVGADREAAGEAGQGDAAAEALADVVGGGLAGRGRVRGDDDLLDVAGVDAEDLKIAELLSRVERGGVEEVVLATNPTTTGEATALYIGERLRGQVNVTRLASGLPVGADLEHADEVTLGKALAGRRAL